MWHDRVRDDEMRAREEGRGYLVALWRGALRGELMNSPWRYVADRIPAKRNFFVESGKETLT